MLKDETISASEFLLSFQRGEEQGFAWVFNQYYEGLCYYAFSLTRNKEESEDIVQQVFHNLWHMREDFSKIQSIKSYLYRSVHNTCIKCFSKEKTRQKIFSVLESGETIVYRQDEIMIRSEIYSTVFNLLEQLPPIFSEVIYLYYIKEKKINDIAEMLNIPIQTVKSRKARGLQSLRKMLPGYFKLITVLVTASLYWW